MLILRLNWKNRNESNILSLKDVSVSVIKSGKRGRPRKVIDEELLTEAFKSTRKITQTRLASALGLHRHTLRRRMRDNHVSLPSQRSNMSEPHLDRLVTEFRERRPDSGETYLRGDLLRQGIQVPRSKVRESRKRVDPVGVQVRCQAPIQRRQYVVKRPNAIWHGDGYHKLILFGIVIHGLVDGYSRKVS
jgi:hypothetical protein